MNAHPVCSQFLLFSRAGWFGTGVMQLFLTYTPCYFVQPYHLLIVKRECQYASMNPNAYMTVETICPKMDVPVVDTIQIVNKRAPARASHVREKFKVSRSDSYMFQRVRFRKCFLIFNALLEEMTATCFSSSSFWPLLRKLKIGDNKEPIEMVHLLILSRYPLRYPSKSLTVP